MSNRHDLENMFLNLSNPEYVEYLKAIGVDMTEQKETEGIEGVNAVRQYLNIRC